MTGKKIWGAIFLLFTPAAALGGLFVALARRIVKPGSRTYRRAELVDGGARLRIECDEYTKASGRFGVIDPQTERGITVGKVTRINERQGWVERTVESPPPEEMSPVVDWTPDVFFTPEAITTGVHNVLIPTQFGQAPAWLFAGKNKDVWVIHIHGSWTSRAIMLRDVHAFKGLGLTSLVPSFRSDPEVEPLQARTSHLGLTEWLDIDSAITYAVEQGAKKIILSGWSMGGTIALLAAENSTHRAKVVAMVLVGPVTSWRKTILAGASRAGVPAPIATGVMWLLEYHTFSQFLGLDRPLDFEALDWISVPGRVKVPTLVLQSTADNEVPWGLSTQFQHANQELVTMVALPDALHTQEWNAAPETFTHTLTSWVNATLEL